VKSNTDQSFGVETHQIFVDLTRAEQNVRIMNQTVTSDSNGSFNFTFPADLLLPHRSKGLLIRVSRKRTVKHRCN